MATQYQPMYLIDTFHSEEGFDKKPTSISDYSRPTTVGVMLLTFKITEFLGCV